MDCLKASKIKRHMNRKHFSLKQACGGASRMLIGSCLGAGFAVSLVLLAPLKGEANSATWNSTGSGDWSVSSNWTPVTVPNGTGQTATLGTSITQNANITVDIPITIDGITINNTTPYNYTISGSNSLTFVNPIGNFSVILQNQGASTISAPITTEGLLQIRNNSTEPLTISGAVSAPSGPVLLTSNTVAPLIMNAISADALQCDIGIVQFLSSPTANTVSFVDPSSTNFTCSIPTGNLAFDTLQPVGTAGGTATSIYTFDIASNASFTVPYGITNVKDVFDILTKIGEGDLIIFGGVSQVIYELHAGKLIVDSNESLESNAMNFYGGTLQIQNSITITDNLLSLFLPSALDTQEFLFTQPNAILGTSYFTKLGSGILYLTNNANSNSYGGVVLAEGTVNVAGERSLGALTSQITLSGGTLQTDNSFSLGSAHAFTTTSAASSIDTQSLATTLTVASGISGSGGLHKRGPGTLVLTGANSFAGDLEIHAGTVQGNTASLPSNMINHGTVIFNQSASGTFDHSITGSAGTLLKQGSALLNLSGSSVSQDSISVEAGALAVNEAVTLVSGMTVHPSAFLLGTGTISLGAPLINQGTVQPGNSIGTLHIAGDYVQATGSTLEIEVNPTQHDQLLITGSMTIQPNTNLSILLDVATYPPSQNFSIVNAQGGFPSGIEIENITVTPPLFEVHVEYEPQDIVLLINVMPITALVNSGNIGALARCLANASPPDGSDLEMVINQLFFSTRDQLEATMEAMQPSLFTSLAVASESSAFRMQSTLSRRQRSLFWDCEMTPQKWHLWVDETFNAAAQNSTGLEPGFSTKTPASLLGADYVFRNAGHFGVIVGYSQDRLRWDQQRGTGSIQNLYEGVYGGFKGQSGYIQGSLMTAFGLYEGHRRIPFIGIYDTLPTRVAAHKNHGFLADGRLEMGASFGCLTVAKPYVSGDFVFLTEKGFTEHGADSIDLSVRKYRASALRMEVGTELSHRNTSSIGSLDSHARVAWAFEQRYQGKRLVANLDNQLCDFTVYGLNPNRSLFSFTLGLTGMFAKDLCFISADYTGEFGSQYRSNAGSLQVQLNF